MPSFLSHIIAATTLAIPAMIISETSLSFLGLGLRPPAISWGVLLQQAQNIQSLAISPWLLVPARARDRGHRRLQLHGRRPARRRRPLRSLTRWRRRDRRAAPVRPRPAHVLLRRGGRGQGGGRRELRRARGAHARHRRGERLRQERDRAVHPPHRRAAGADRGRRRSACAAPATEARTTSRSSTREGRRSGASAEARSGSCSRSR